MSDRNGIRATLWIAAVFAVLCGLSVALWGTLSLAGDNAGAVVARVLSLVCGIVLGLDLAALVVLLARIQLVMLEADESSERS
ncbi:MAG: hypothetical protein V4719_15270 [Planctomycetota bacterium]